MPDMTCTPNWHIIPASKEGVPVESCVCGDQVRQPGESLIDMVLRIGRQKP